MILQDFPCPVCLLACSSWPLLHREDTDGDICHTQSANTSCIVESHHPPAPGCSRHRRCTTLDSIRCIPAVMLHAIRCVDEGSRIVTPALAMRGPPCVIALRCTTNRYRIHVYLTKLEVAVHAPASWRTTDSASCVRRCACRRPILGHYGIS